MAESRGIPRGYKQHERRCRNGHDPDAENTISTALLAYFVMNFSYEVFYLNFTATGPRQGCKLGVVIFSFYWKLC